MNKVYIIGTDGLPAQYGGFETLTEHLVSNLSETTNITVYCSSKNRKEKPEYYKSTQLKYLPFSANGIQSIIYDISSMILASKKADTMLVLGVSGCVFLPILKLFYKGKLVINIDGLEWKRGKWNKAAKFFLKFSERIAVKYADSVIGDNPAIVSYIEKNYALKAHMIPYGGNHVAQVSLSKQTLAAFPFLSQPYAFKVCRIEPENNIKLILEAFTATSELPLVIIGNWKSSDYGLGLRQQYAKHKNIHLLDPIYDQTVLNEIRSNCFIYVHGHSAGGTNPSLVEAMHLELPVITFDVDYNRETTQNKAIYFKDSNELARIISSLDNTELTFIAASMKKIGNELYTWEKVFQQYEKLIKQN